MQSAIDQTSRKSIISDIEKIFGFMEKGNNVRAAAKLGELKYKLCKSDSNHQESSSPESGA